MAKLQCARLTKFIIPSVTDRPTESRNSSIPYANPSKSTPASEANIFLFLSALPGGVFYVLDPVERHVDVFVADLLHAADVDRLHHVARVGIDRHRPARAVPLHPLGGGDQRLAVGVAAGLLAPRRSRACRRSRRP